LGLAS
jgi:hypothetical protein